jgi:hypothetical protein
LRLSLPANTAECDLMKHRDRAAGPFQPHASSSGALRSRTLRGVPQEHLCGPAILRRRTGYCGGASTPASFASASKCRGCGVRPRRILITYPVESSVALRMSASEHFAKSGRRLSRTNHRADRRLRRKPPARCSAPYCARLLRAARVQQSRHAEARGAGGFCLHHRVSVRGSWIEHQLSREPTALPACGAQT